MFVDSVENKGQKFSFSKYNTFMGCPKKYFWSYVRGLVPAEEAAYFVTGRQFHGGVAGMEGESLWHKIGRLAKQYFKPLPGETPEVRKEVEIDPGVILECVADSVADEYVVEYKTTSRPDANTCNSLALSLQNRLYAIVFSKPRFLLRVVAKPKIRQKSTENEQMFEQRIYETVAADPQNHFLEIEIPVIKEGAIREFLASLKHMRYCEERGVFPTSAPHACYGFSPCPYMPLCVDEATNLPLFKAKERTE